jgi:hypothetical protein
MEAACRHVLATSEFMPVVATIRQAVDVMRKESVGREEYAGPRQLSYPPTTQAERDAAIGDIAEFTAQLKARLGKPNAPLSPTGKEIKIVPPIRTHEQAKAELERRGYLSSKPHSPACLCPDCRKRRERM